ncbi:His/Gly/Thr/Pro-type tRNA ligase C-terminal domain-containing protein [Mesobacillus zeae]|uniref:His/Gly/Thr/Pro-type tRNA ligase C-terminal domain-containing protein n=1 Tax=Mesobacillus zeae TaxID=1917180 RepID=UPI00300AA39C
MDYCLQIQLELKQLGVRVKIDKSNEKLGYKIREAQMQKVPYMLVLGDNEVNENAVNVRKYGDQQSESVPFESFKKKIVQQIKERSK